MGSDSNLRRSAGVFSFLILGCLYFLRTEAGPYSALVVEVDSERVLYSQNADEIRHPASLTKMMTLYLLFEAITNGQINLNDTMRASFLAVNKPPSKLGLRVGESLTVEDAIRALVTQSANDAATVIAEHLGGSEPAFASMMTQKARQLGMNNTIFHNASGLPNPDQITSAWDMFRLGKSLQKHFPQFYHYFSTESFEFRGRVFRNHNHLLENYPGTDGIKTGFVNASGFNLVASARRGSNRLIGVVFGGNTHSRRDAHMREILDDGFAQLEGHEARLHFPGFGGPDTIALLRRPGETEPVDLHHLKRPPTRAERLAAKRHTRELEAVENARTASAASSRNRQPKWQVSVGEFPREAPAEHCLSQAMKAAPTHLRHAKGAVSARAHRGKKTYVAYFTGINKDDAASACKELKRKGLNCSAYGTVD